MNQLFDKNDWIKLKEIFLEFNKEKTSYSQEELEKEFNSLPGDFQSDAYEWGLKDKSFRNKIKNYFNR